MTPDAPPPGRREANKRATREALQAAADRLFAERGFADTTVQDIAEAAGVTERTFFRYFGGKEDLVLDDALVWLAPLTDAIRQRPLDEPPLLAIQLALAGVAAEMDAVTGHRPTPLWLFIEGPPGGKFRGRTAGKLLLTVESALADALRDRLGAQRSARADFRCDVLARSAVAAVRSALIRDWQLREAGATERPALGELMTQAFTDVATAGEH